MRRRGYLLFILTTLVISVTAQLPAQNIERLPNPEKERLGPSHILFWSCALEGYTAPKLAEEAEYLNFGFGVDPVQSPLVSAAIGLHWLLPFNPLEVSASYVGLACDVTLGRYLTHPFGRLFARKVSLAPMVSIGGYVQPGGTKSAMFLISCQPLRFFSGDGYYTAGAFDIVLDKSLRYSGWGIRLFDFTYFVH